MNPVDGIRVEAYRHVRERKTKNKKKIQKTNKTRSLEQTMQMSFLGHNLAQSIPKLTIHSRPI